MAIRLEMSTRLNVSVGNFLIRRYRRVSFLPTGILMGKALFWFDKTRDDEASYRREILFLGSPRSNLTGHPPHVSIHSYIF